MFWCGLYLLIGIVWHFFCLSTHIAQGNLRLPEVKTFVEKAELVSGFVIVFLFAVIAWPFGVAEWTMRNDPDDD